MSEEKEPVSPGEEDAAFPTDALERRPTRAASRSQERRRRKSVFQYIAILFAAAFVLLLFTFIMERRQHELLQEENQEQIDNLQQSVSAVQSLQNLYNENDRLKERVAALEEQVAGLERDAAEMESAVNALSTQLDKTREAMDWFWQLDEAYVRGRYSLCRDIIQTMEETAGGSPLKDFLAKKSATNNDRFSPADRYWEIYDALN